MDWCKAVSLREEAQIEVADVVLANKERGKNDWVFRALSLGFETLSYDMGEDLVRCREHAKSVQAKWRCLGKRIIWVYRSNLLGAVAIARMGIITGVRAVLSQQKLTKDLWDVNDGIGEGRARAFTLLRLEPWYLDRSVSAVVLPHHRTAVWLMMLPRRPWDADRIQKGDKYKGYLVRSWGRLGKQLLSVEQYAEELHIASDNGWKQLGVECRDLIWGSWKAELDALHIQSVRKFAGTRKGKKRRWVDGVINLGEF